MTGKSRNLFKLVSMLLVASSLYCAFGILGGGEVRFWISLCITSLIGIAYLILFMQNEKELEEAKKKADDSPDDTSTVSRYFMKYCPIPAIVADETGTVRAKTKGAAELLPELKDLKMLGAPIDVNSLTADSNGEMKTFEWEHYRVEYFTAVNTGETGRYFTFLFFKDLSEAHILREEAEDSRNYVALLLIDEYDELFSYEKDSKRSEVVIKIDKIAEKFVEKHNGLLKKLSDDKYFAILSEKELKHMEEKDYLALLEEMHSIHVSERTHVSLSMGIGRGGNSLRESEEIARSALSVSQKQGGDHVVIKSSNNDTSYVSYGGASTKTEVNSQSKVKLFSDRLKDHAKASDKIIIMGHNFSDMDAVGAASGLGGALRALGFSAYVYVNRETTLAMSLIERLYANIENEAKELFISEEDALELITEDTLVIIVDTNGKRNIDSPAIYEKAAKVIYIDHHIQTQCPIDNFIDRYHDSEASSASEIVTEVIRYNNLKNKLSCYYADALLSGITLDTKDFVMKTGVRTFEAAAYLKDLGADPVSVKLLFANSFDIDKLRSKLVEGTENYNNYAITCLGEDTFKEYSLINDDELETARRIVSERSSQNGVLLSGADLDKAAVSYAADKKAGIIKVAAAQAADQLLNTLNIKASFAVFRTNDNNIKISARSYGTVSGGANVQDIVKRLGGGGHITMAAVDIKNKSLEDVCGMLRNALDEYDSAMKSI
ncbi:DHH family phosphoesterase [Huintestinicola sp.]|uniref:DHH family phosphoesterase n=1 Tax=Huintestinicola sp. TaxID=2981661 RepID=UPI003D7E4DC9